MTTRTDAPNAPDRRERKNAMTTPLMEPMEARRLLSVTLTEAEPNNSMAAADVIPRELGASVKVNGKLGALGDRDWFKVTLKAGDVIGAVVRGKGGLDTNLRLVDAAGRLLIGNDDGFGWGVDDLSANSPVLQRSGSDLDAEVYRVIERPGTYYLEVSASPPAAARDRVGNYQVELTVARPGMEAQRAGARQILFLDFDGVAGPIAWREFATAGPLSPMKDFLPGFNLTAADEDAVIDRVVARLKTLLVDRVRADGLNDDVMLEVRNSRDHRDTFGKDPLVSRLVIGGTAAEANFVGDLAGVAGIAENADVGNYATDDQAICTLSWITDAVDIVSAAAPVTQVELMAEGIAMIAAHEAGHLFGCDHTDQAGDDQYGGVPSIMDPSITAFIGPDLTLGTADDLDVHFEVEAYDASGLFAGVNDTVNTVAFGLSVGQQRVGRGHVHGDGPLDGGAKKTLFATAVRVTDDDRDDRGDLLA
jgi:hypothetical protein